MVATLSAALLAVLLSVSIGAPIIAVRQALLRHRAEQSEQATERSEQAAKGALEKAELQQKRAEGVNAFLTDEVFGLADPNRGGRHGPGLGGSVGSCGRQNRRTISRRSRTVP